MMESSVKYQYYATLCVNICSFGHGMTVGWTSPFLSVLMSHDTPLKSGPITLEEASWIGSLLSLGGLFGTLFFGWMADAYGRKISGIALGIPQILNWLCIIFADSVAYLFVARFLAGLAAGGIFVIVPLYVTEIAEDKIRGALGSIMIFSLNVGTLFCFIIGTYMSYMLVQIIGCFVPIIFLISLFFLPETPHYLIKQNKVTEAEDALKYLRGFNDASIQHSSSFKLELDNLTKMIVTDDESKTPEISSSKGIQLSDFNSTAAKKGLVMGIGLAAMNQLSGCFALISYTAQIFEEAKTGLDPNLSAIIIGFIQIAGSYASTFFVDRAGRRVLYLTSAMGSGLGLFAMGTYSFVKHLEYDVSSFNYIPVISLSFVIFIATVGILPLAFVIISELSPNKIRAFVTTVCMTALWIFAFTVIKYFSLLVLAFGLHGCMWFFSFCCFVGFILYGLFVPETKGKSFDEIRLELEK